MASYHRTLYSFLLVPSVVCWLWIRIVQAQVGRPQGISAAGIHIPPLPPIIQRGTFNSTHGEVLTTDVYGIKTYINQAVTYQMIVSDVTDHVCGSRSICNTDTSLNWLCSFECSNCKCDEKCHFYGDCCARKLFEFSSAVPSIRPDFVTCGGAEDIKWGGLSHIFMVTKCPQTSLVDVSTRLKCDSPDLLTLSEATPVSDMTSQITYANRFCAVCHGVHEYQSWSQQVKCPFVTTLQKASTRDELWRLVMADKSCTKEFLPPPNLEVRECYPYTHGSCNVTGKWVEHISPLTEILCNLYDHTVDYYGTTAVPVTYKNVFCAICNGASLRFTPVCQRQASSFPEGLSILLHFKSTAEEKSSSSSPCPRDEIYDPFSGTCQDLNCPSRRILLDGECNIPYLSCSGLGFSYVQEFRPVYDVYINKTSFVNEYEAYFKAFFIEFKPIVLMDFEIKFYVKKDISSISSDVEVVRVTGKFISGSSERTVENIEWRIKEFLSSPWIFNINNDTLVSTQIACSLDETLVNDYRLKYIQTYHYDATLRNTGIMGSFSPIDVDCPFLEYDLSLAKFTFFSNTSTLVFEGQEAFLNATGFYICSNALKICSNVIQEINEISFSNTTIA